MQNFDVNQTLLDKLTELYSSSLFECERKLEEINIDIGNNIPTLQNFFKAKIFVEYLSINDFKIKEIKNLFITYKIRKYNLNIILYDKDEIIFEFENNNIYTLSALLEFPNLEPVINQINTIGLYKRMKQLKTLASTLISLHQLRKITKALLEDFSNGTDSDYILNNISQVDDTRYNNYMTSSLNNMTNLIEHFYIPQIIQYINDKNKTS